MTMLPKYPAPKVDQTHPPVRAQELVQLINAAVDRYRGNFDELEKAIGVLMLGDYVGWKVLALVHNKRTIRKYEEILGISMREFFVEEGPIAMRSMGYRVALSMGSFWKAVSGDIPVENRRELDGNS
jgi:hypothetical protein